MGKFDINDILSDLGITSDEAEQAAKAERARRKPDSAPGEDGAGTDDAPGPARPKHRIDQAEQAFSPLPSVPSGQRSFSESVVVDDDPSVPVKPLETPRSNVGNALAEVYKP